MSLTGPGAEDVRKLHGEINQLVNQRYLVTSLAITVFGVITAWQIPRQTPREGEPVGSFAFAGSTLLLVLLFLLYAFSHQLEGRLRAYTSYLHVTGTSGWEKDWARYRKECRPFAYTQSQAVVFAVLGLIAAAFPIVFARTYGLRLEPASGLRILLWTVAVYEVLVLAWGFGRFPEAVEERHFCRWQHLADTGGTEPAGPHATPGARSSPDPNAERAPAGLVMSAASANDDHGRSAGAH
jgi:hypothetical protein